MRPTDYLTARQAAEECGQRPQSISNAIRRGYLPAVKVGRDWLIHPADLIAYLDGRPESYKARQARPSGHTD